MKWQAAFISLLLVWLASFPAAAQEHSVPGSARSRKAVQEQTGNLTSLFARKKLRLGNPVFIRIFKETSELEVWIESPSGGVYHLLKTYRICYFSGGLGTKTKQGDGKSPEGFYYVKPGQLNPSSNFYLSFNIGYPNAYDRFHGYTGSAIMVHGNCVSIGCYAMGDENIAEIWTILTAAFEQGQPYVRVHIFPFRMTAADLHRHNHPEWNNFWGNLAEGYQYFEQTRKPPNVKVQRGRYIFE